MLARTLAVIIAVVSLFVPAAAGALRLAPRVGVATVIEDGPDGSGAAAWGSAWSVGVAAGAPWLSLVADLAFRQASVASEDLASGWKEYETRDTVVTVGLHSEFEVLPGWLTGAELHVGRSSSGARALANPPVSTRDGDVYVVYGGAAEASYLVTSRFSLGVRGGADRFAHLFWGDTLMGDLDLSRTSYTAGLIAGLRL